MRQMTSPIWFALLGGIDVAALALAVRKLGVARRAAAGDLSGAIELSSLDATFSFVLPLALVGLVLTLASALLLCSRLGRGAIATTLVSLPAAAGVACAVASALLDEPSAETGTAVTAAMLLVAACAAGIASAVQAGMGARSLRLRDTTPT